jgi:hypothetical protein
MKTSTILAAAISAVACRNFDCVRTSGSPEAAQQNFAKKPTDLNTTNKPVNATDKPAQNDEQNATNRRQEAPKSGR